MSDDILTKGHLERVAANPAEAGFLIKRAQAHLETAEREADRDPEIAYDALYDAAAKR